ncbi:MAG: ABC transporter permease subunit, partial [Candidatus Thalassarchaeaceae archaeon]|nr:ABC transporter permease subunit [Candidatus Thalassarchaeaceae archaeon]
FFVWGFIISGEGAKPSVQSKRMSAFAFLALFPLFSYLFLRVLFLMNDGSDPVMLNRWSLEFDFMVKGNTFAINPWPIDVEPNIDSRWVFLKAAVINSARVTLVSIVLCTILGILVGVSRLSSNRLASGAATVYVELFRNLPLAVLLFLISVQIGQDLPMNNDIDAASAWQFDQTVEEIDGVETVVSTTQAAYISKQGIHFVDFSSYEFVLVGLAILALTRVGLRYFDRDEPRVISQPRTPVEHLFRPFSSLGWRLEPLAADTTLVASAFLFISATFPFLAASSGGDAQDLVAIIGDATYPIASLFFVIYCLAANSSIDSDGMNNLEVDDSDEGLRRRFTVWAASFAIALGIALSGGISWPEFTKDWNNDGVIDQPGSWTIVGGTGFEITPAFFAMMLGLTLFTTAVVAEIVRGSIQSLPRGQVEAAISLSLNPFQRLRLVILPQALRSMVPLLNSQYMNVWKNSSLAIVVGYTDVFYNIVVMMNNVGKLIPLFVLLLVTYQVGSLSISVVMNWYNSKVTSVKI